MASKEKKLSNQEDNSLQSEFIRRFKSNPFIFIGTIVILVIVIVAFVFVPAIAPNMGGPVADMVFGVYDKSPIAYVPNNYFAQLLQRSAAMRQFSLNSDYRQNLQTAITVWQDAYQGTVAHVAILKEMEKAGYTPPAQRVDQEMAQLPDFQENGRFSITRYRELDNTTRMAVWRQIQDSITEERYTADIMGLKISSGETSFIGAMASPKRSFDMAVFPLSAYPDTEIAAYASANADLFRVTHFSLITISSNEQEAQKILDSIKDGTTTFEDAARTYSLDSYAERGGDMGIKMAYELSTEIPDAGERDAVIRTARGEYSPIVKVPSGWAFFRAEDAPYPADIGDTSLQEKIRSYMTGFERGRIEDWLINEAQDLIVQIRETDFDTALTQKGLEKRSFGPLPLNYGGDTIYYSGYSLLTSLASFSVPEFIYTGVDTNENFWQEAFFTPLNTPANPLVLGNYVVVLYPREEIPEDEGAIDTIETSYSSYWLSYITSRGIRSHFLKSDKLEDRFENTFITYLLPTN